MSHFDSIVLLGAVVLIAAIVSARIGSRVGLPSLLLFLGLGIVLRTVLPDYIPDVTLARDLGFGALVLILAEGGMTTRWIDIRPSVGMAAALSTVGIGVSVALMALFGHYVLGLELWVAVLLGAVTSPTDAAAVFSVLRDVAIPHRLRGALEAESGLNDAPAVLLVMLASSAATAGSAQGGGLQLVALIAVELLGGLVIGAVLGWLGVEILRRVALPSTGLYPLAALVWTVFAYGVGAMAHTSGFAAVYVCALLLGNAQLPHRGATRSFVEGIGWMAQIGLFVMLGLLADPAAITAKTVLVALAAGFFLTLVARPVSVYVTTVWFKVTTAEQTFLSWAGLRGAIPIILATIPLSSGVGQASFLFNVVLVFVVVFTCLQAPTLPVLARRLGLVDDDAARDVEVEAAPLDKISADLLQVRIPLGSRLSGVEIGELRLPEHTMVSLVIRDQAAFSPELRERIKAGDELLIVTPTAQRLHTEERLRSLGRRGRLAGWRSGPVD